MRGCRVGVGSEGIGVQDFGKKYRIEAFSLLTSSVSFGAIFSEGRGGGGTYTRDRLDKVPPGL